MQSCCSRHPCNCSVSPHEEDYRECYAVWVLGFPQNFMCGMVLEGLGFRVYA